ncbi:MAG: hypothetical protein FJ279_23765, partial [Planctomycetes bacterium]|nr:hypothetical protein [Planctomycetota bacterium]
MRRKALVLEVLLLALFSISACPAATLVVDLNGTGDFTDIQSAIDAAEDGDTVLVKPGEYVIDEPINFNRLHNPDDPASPPVKNITLKSEGGADVTTIRMAETPADPERASVVIFENGEGNNGTLEGFTLSGGGRIGVLWQRGGGIFCIGSSPTIKSCKISGNLASGWCLGHGESPPSPCGEGGGVSCEGGSSPTLTNCTISGNSANFGGGGVFCQGNSFPTLTNCTISGNSAIEGGGVCCEWGSSPTLTNCTISGNLGGAVYCSSSSPTFTSCIVWGNLGGSILTEGESHPIVT